MISKKGAIEISYSWIFAIFAGVVIVFLALYVSSKLINTGQQTMSAKTGKEIGVLLNPLETDFQSSQSTTITIPVETRINNICDVTESKGVFGSQGINIEQKSFKKWVDTDLNVEFENKYIFSQKQIEGKVFYIFSKQFQSPFKVADLFYFISSKQRYCFKDAPGSVVEEISSLGNETYIVAGNCSKQDITVCFGNDQCNMSVVIGSNNFGYVLKDGEKLYFTLNENDGNSLMYAAIFADKEIYECQVQRLMSRLSELSMLYANKEGILKIKGCEGNLGEDLISLGSMASAVNASSQIPDLTFLVNRIEGNNEGRECALW